MSYDAPLREMMFAMREHGGLDAVLAQPGNEEVGFDVAEAILDEAAKFAANVLGADQQARRRAGVPLAPGNGEHGGGLQGRLCRLLRQRLERLDNLEDPYRVFRCRSILNCVDVCPKHLLPAAAIGKIKQMMVRRSV